MWFLNFFAFILIFRTVFVSADDGPYIPCKSYISFSFDDSNFMRNEDFMTQINFIKNAIGTLNYPERLRAEGGYTAEFNWNSGLSLAQMQSSFDFAEQTLMSYSLLQEFASLVTSLTTLDSTNDPIGALIFISDTSDRALLNADRLLAQLSNIRITFVLLGPNADQNKLTRFSSYFITWRDLSNPQPDNWDMASVVAYGCSNPISTVTMPIFTTSLPMLSTSATSMPSTTAQTSSMPMTGSTSEQYIPCQSWISFSYDDSNVLQNANFKTQMSFISSVIGSLNFPNRIRIQGAYTDVASWNSGQNIPQMQNELLNSEQTANPYSLLLEFANLVNYLPTNQWPVGALVFISDTSDQALKNAYRFIPQLSNVRLTFVLLGTNVDSTKLTNFTSNYIYWSDLSKPQPDNWDAVSASALGCTNPSSVSTLQPLSSTTQRILTGPTSMAPTGTTTAPFIPCQSWISFGVDDSNVLPNNNFMTQLSFISSAIGNITHPERIAAVGIYAQPVPWDSGLTIQEIQYSIHYFNQDGPYSLQMQFSALLSNLQNIHTENTPVATLIFISDTSDAALSGADVFMSQLNGIQITFVLLGPNVDSSKLTQFSNNFIYWSDLSKPQPDNWDAVSASAFGCSNPSSASTLLPLSSPTQGISTGPTSMAPTGTTTAPFIPCQSWISFGVDDSNVLPNDNFMTQLFFVSSAIGNITHPERIAANGMYSQDASWNSGLTIQEIQYSINYFSQVGPYSLRMQFAALLSDLQNTETENAPVASLIFISDTSDSALSGADVFMSQLNGIQITFVLLGSNVDSSKLTQFSNNFIYWTELSKPQPDNWDTASVAAYGCTNLLTTMLPSSSAASTATPTTISTSMAPTGTTITPYIPCRSWISFSYDDSNVLQEKDFETQMLFISSVIETLNYPDRLRMSGAFTAVASWNSHQTISQMQNELSNSEQTLNGYSLLLEVANLLTDVEAIGSTNWPIGALIFISDTSDQAIRRADQYISQLSNVRITFVLLGTNIDSAKLTNFTSNFIYWSDLSKPQPDNWDAVSASALGCSNPSSVSMSPPVSTLLPLSSSLAPTTGPTSTSTSMAPTGTTRMAYLPCQSWISFSYDDSSSLQSNNFKTQMNFIASSIGAINYPDRFRVNGAFTGVASWNSHQTISQIQAEINSAESTSNSYSLLLQFAGLLTDIETIGSTNWPIGAIIFISDTSDAALAHANIYSSQLPPNVRLTFVLLGANVDQTKLTQFSSNFILWKDLSQPQPDNWDTSFFNAYGC